MKNSNVRRLIITRHGEQCSENGLTPRGVSQIEDLAKTLSAADITPDSIIASYPLRTQKSAGILATHFQRAANRTEDFLNTFKFDMDGFLKSLQDNQRTVLIAAHEETIQCFGHHLLDDHDTGHFFDLLPDSRKTRHDHEDMAVLFSCHMHHADALILVSDDTRATGWSLHGLVLDGTVLTRPSDNEPLTQGKKYKALPDFPEILLELPE